MFFESLFHENASIVVASEFSVDRASFCVNIESGNANLFGSMTHPYL